MASRAWCFTFHGDNVGDVDIVANIEAADEADRSKVRALVYQQEICPDTGRKHLQGYVRFASPVRFTFLQRVLGVPGAHCEKPKGSDEQNVAYCSKEESRDPDAGE